MRLVACVLAFNDAWCIGFSVRAALRYCDEVIVGLHRSEDLTSVVLDDIVHEVGRDRLFVVEQDNVVPRLAYPIEQVGGVYRREHLGWLAVAYGATHVAVIDSDEVMTGNVAASIRSLAEESTVYLPWVSVWDDPSTYRTTWRQMLPFVFQVSGGSHWLGSTHGRFPACVASSPYPSEPHVAFDSGGVLHFSYTSRRRLAAKRLMYRICERVFFKGSEAAAINAKFNDSIIAPGPDEMKPIPQGWWSGIEDLRQHLHPDDVPWHEEECRRLVKLHGRAILDGLDLGGVEV